jgi:hypothetical protein
MRQRALHLALSLVELLCGGKDTSDDHVNLAFDVAPSISAISVR